MRALVYDFETPTIEPGDPHPHPVCMAVCEVLDDYTIGDPVLMLGDEGVALLEQARDEGVVLVAHNGAQFDVWVAAKATRGDIEEEVGKWLAAAERGQLEDTMLRQKLLDGAVDARDRLYEHNLRAVVDHWGGPAVDKDDPWRMRYRELIGVPIEQYPHEAAEYPKRDVLACAWIWVSQEAARRGYVSQANGVDYKRYFPQHDALADQHRQVMKAIALGDVSAAGMYADEDSVDRFERQLTDERDAILPALLDAGLVRREIKKNKDAIVNAFRAAGVELEQTAKGAPRLDAKAYAKVPAALAHDLLLTSAKLWKEGASLLADRGSPLVDVSYVKCEDNARRMMWGWFQSFACDGEPTFSSEPTPGEEWRKVQLTKDNAKRSGSPVLVNYAEYSSLIKTLGSDIPLLRGACRAPFHAHYTSLKDNGRTATGSEGGEGNAGNVQNMPRMPGVRECWTAPRGWMIAEADYSAAELSTFGQVSEWVVGWSECARMIRDGIDQHAVFGAALTGHPDPKGAGWRELKAAIKAGDKAAKKGRNGGKGVNFGCKAGMSAKRYADYAYNSYGLDVTLDEAAQHIRLHDELIAEMPYYYAWCDSMAREPGEYNTRHDLVHPLSGRLRADLSYTDIRNYPFSGLAQDMAAVALWTLLRVRWGHGPRGRDDAFYGCRPFLFVHDSIAAYVPDDLPRARAAAARLGEIMTECAAACLPDVGCKAEPNLVRQLSKLADDPILNEAGEIIPFDVFEVCRSVFERDGETACGRFPRWVVDKVKEEIEQCSYSDYF